MPCLASPPPPPLPPENPASGFRIFVSFSRSDELTGATVSNWLDNYDLANNTWEHVGPIPGIPRDHVLKGFAMVALLDFVYIIGGRLCRKIPAGALDADGSTERDVAVRADVLRYHVPTGEWSACAPLRLPRFDFACVACNGRIYVAGGQCTLSGGRGTAAAEAYDPAQESWAALPGMGALRYKCAGVAWQGRFHVVGGFAEREGAGGPVERSSAEVFDEARGKWDLVPGMWQLDVPPNQIVAVDGRLLSSGDCLNDWKGHVEVYDGELNIWSAIERSQLHDLSELVAAGDEGHGRSLQRAYLTMAAIGTHLYFLAGYRVVGEESRSMTAVHSFDTAVHSFDTAAQGAMAPWRTSEPLMEDRDKELCSHCCVLRLS